MSELTLIVERPTSAGSATAGLDDAQRKILVRTGGVFGAGSFVEINSPGAGWAELGPDLSFLDTQDFIDYTQVYRNGQLLYVLETGNLTNPDAFVSVAGLSVLLSFPYPISTNEVITIWKFTKVV